MNEKTTRNDSKIEESGYESFTQENKSRRRKASKRN